MDYIYIELGDYLRNIDKALIGDLQTDINLCLNLQNGYYLISDINNKNKNSYIVIKIKHVESGAIISQSKFCINGREEGFINITDLNIIKQYIFCIYYLFIIFNKQFIDISIGRK